MTGSIPKTFKPSTAEELRDIVKHEMRYRGKECDLNHIDVSKINAFYGVFADLAFNGTIDQWDVSQATSMVRMFARSKFNGDISQWDVSNVRSMLEMFQASHFNGDVSQWRIQNVTDFSNMFRKSMFTGDLSKWHIPHGAQVANMLPLGFKSQLPRSASNYIAAFYATALGGYQEMEHYLANMPFNRAHASIALLETPERYPLALRGERFDWIMEQRALLEGMGVGKEDAPDLLVQAHHAKTVQNAPPDNFLSFFDL